MFCCPEVDCRCPADTVVNARSRTSDMSSSYTCNGCGAALESVDDLRREPTTTGRSWYCRYCRAPVPGIVGERLSHRRDGSATDR